MRYSVLLPGIFALLIISCKPAHKPVASGMDGIAEKYVKLVLEIGLYDKYYIDAYHGPDEWKPEEISEDKAKNFPSEELRQKAEELLTKLNAIRPAELDEMEKYRHSFLYAHVAAALGNIERLAGVKMTFEDESKIFYGATAPKADVEFLRSEIKEMLTSLPGQGTAAERLESLRSPFIIPSEKLDTIMQVAVEECRRRTALYIDLPEHESIEIELVSNQPWGAYNWYKGNAHSLIQLNTDRPSTMDYMVNYLSHEVYPGHHLHLSLMDLDFAQERGWVEFTVSPLYAPLSFIAEGIAEVGGSIIFTEAERTQFEKEVLFPIAGLDTNGYSYYKAIQKQLSKSTTYLRLEISRAYFDGKLTREQATEQLMNDLSYTNQRANQALDFVDAYGSYIINYSTGEDLLHQYINRKVQGTYTPQKAWEVFEQILRTPVIASDLQE
jgi:hypothetical protein